MINNSSGKTITIKLLQIGSSYKKIELFKLVSTSLRIRHRLCCMKLDLLVTCVECFEKHKHLLMQKVRQGGA